MADFDANDIESWYFGDITREETENALHLDSENGVFLVRLSSTKTAFVLSVKIADSVQHYIIEIWETSNKELIYKSGENLFKRLQDLLEYFKTYPLEDNFNTTLFRPPVLRLHPISPLPQNLLRTSNLPVEAVVVTEYQSTAYASDDLELEVGQKILVIDMSPSGRWEGMTEDQTKRGFFPFAHVELITSRYRQSNDLITFDV